MTRQVVFGSGQVGRLLAEQLVGLEHDVLVVNRSGRTNVRGAAMVAGDATDIAFTTRACTGADVVYFCLNPSSYACWEQEFPPLQRGVLRGAQTAGARLVVLDNLYSYGPSGGQWLSESSAVQPTSAKAAVRATMTEALLGAHRRGLVEVAIGRASDYFGPGTRASALGEGVFGTALTGRSAQVLGNPDLPHSYSYTPDVAAALIALGTREGSTGAVWHLPVAGARTTRQIVTDIYRSAGQQPKLIAAGPTAIRLIGLVKPAMREYLHTMYQFTAPWVVDDSRYRSWSGENATDLDEALATTLAWFRQSADGPAATPDRSSTPFTPRKEKS